MYKKTRWTSFSILKWVEAKFGGIRLYDEDEHEVQDKNEHSYLSKLYNNIHEGIQYPADKIQNVWHYICNRYIEKNHYVPTYLAPGDWHEIDEVLISSMFGLLVDFVEITLANISVEQEEHWFSSKKRCRDRGLKYLEWQSTLLGENGGQAQAAKDQLELYLWWTNIRPNRLDPYESTGYNAFCEKHGLDAWVVDKTELQIMLRQIRGIENDYDAEDTAMMIQLVRLRHTLWA